ncbi:hypothetical protein PQQ53_12370 [Paraburkholderia strydomiana]
MFDVMPYWMRAASLLVWALICGRLSAGKTRRQAGLVARHTASHPMK